MHSHADPIWLDDTFKILILYKLCFLLFWVWSLQTYYVQFACGVKYSLVMAVFLIFNLHVLCHRMVINLARIFHIVPPPACLHNFWLTYHYMIDDFLIILSSVACRFLAFWLAFPAHRSSSFHNPHTYSFTKLPSSQILQILSILCVQTPFAIPHCPSSKTRVPVFHRIHLFLGRIRILLSLSKNR